MLWQFCASPLPWLSFYKKLPSPVDDFDATEDGEPTEESERPSNVGHHVNGGHGGGDQHRQRRFLQRMVYRKEAEWAQPQATLPGQRRSEGSAVTESIHVCKSYTLVCTCPKIGT